MKDVWLFKDTKKFINTFRTEILVTIDHTAIISIVNVFDFPRPLHSMSDNFKDLVNEQCTSSAHFT